MGILINGLYCRNCGYDTMIVNEDGKIECPVCGYWFNDKEFARKIFGINIE